MKKPIKTFKKPNKKILVLLKVIKKNRLEITIIIKT